MPQEQPAETPTTATSPPFVPTPDEEARLRALIGIELERQNATPVARKTLELLIEAAAEPAEGQPGYRIFDRSGETRLRPVTPVQAKKGIMPGTPLTLADLVDELRVRHPDLFGEPAKPEPAPEAKRKPASKPMPVAGRTVRDRLAPIRAAGTRFVRTQSTLVQALAARSVERGRSLAAATGETVGGWRGRNDRRLAEPAQATSPDAAQTPAAPAVPMAAGPAGPRWNWRGLGDNATARVRAGLAHLGPRSGDRSDTAAAIDGGPAAILRRSPLALGLGAFAALGLFVAVLTTARKGNDEAVPEATALRTEATEAPRAPQSEPPASSPSAPGAATPPAAAPPASAPPSDLEEQPDDATSRAPNEIAGTAEVIDTATLRIGGKVVPLFGVEWVRGGQADELTKYLARRPVSCQPAPGSSAYLCSVAGRDLSEVVLFNGGGRASPEASPELVKAEDHARSERLGVWKR